MTNRTITAHDSTTAGLIAGALFTAGSATVDDATTAGRRAIAFARRRRWAVSGGIATAVPVTVANGKPVAQWTVPELKTYLTDLGVEFPADALKPALLAAAQTAFETRAQGGAAAQPTAGHTQGTFPVDGAPLVPGDNATEAAKWSTPHSGDTSAQIAPQITDQPDAVSVIAPATATFTVAATGDPAPSYQWQKKEAAGETFADIADATAASFTTAATAVATDNGDAYRVIVRNGFGSVVSAAVVLTVTAA